MGQVGKQDMNWIVGTLRTENKVGW